MTTVVRKTLVSAYLAVGLGILLAVTPALAEPETSGSAPQSPVYAQNCASCHGQDLKGTSFAPALSGDTFRAKWAAHKAQDLLTFIHEKMPPFAPGFLSQQANTEAANFILKGNNLALLSSDDASYEGNVSDKNGMSIAAVSGNIYLDDTYQKEMARRTALAAHASNVTEKMLAQPPAGDWLHWRRSYDGAGYSPLATIDQTNVKKLQVAWTWSLPVNISVNGIIPLVHDGIMFVNTNGGVMALDATSGDILWKFSRPVVVAGAPLPLSRPKSMAIWDNALYVPTYDNHIIALDFHTGKQLWDHALEPSSVDYHITSGPLVVRGKIIQGVGGCLGKLNPGGCLIVALDAKTGKEVWRFHTVQQPSSSGQDTWNGLPANQRFGGSVWIAGTYDPALNLVYFGIAQTYHISEVMNPADKRPDVNDLLYTDSTVALDPDTGKLKWHYQHLARDVWDLDWAFERILLPVQTKHGEVTGVATIGKLGILDVVNAATGKYLYSYDLGVQNLITHIDPETGAKTIDPDFNPHETPSKMMCPYPLGVRSFGSTSYDPVRKRLYVPANSSCSEYFWKPGQVYDYGFTGLLPKPGTDGNYGQVVAIDLAARKAAWTQSRRAPQTSSVLTTAGGLVFAGARDRWFQASSSDDGKVLWQMRLSDSAYATPISYSVNGVQYVAIAVGGSGVSLAQGSWAAVTPELPEASSATTFWVFKLGDNAGQ